MKQVKAQQRVITKKEKIPCNQGQVMQQCAGCRDDYLGYCFATPFDKPIPCLGNVRSEA